MPVRIADRETGFSLVDNPKSRIASVNIVTAIIATAIVSCRERRGTVSRSVAPNPEPMKVSKMDTGR